MKATAAVGLRFAELRPNKAAMDSAVVSPARKTFPVYEGLADKLCTQPTPGVPNETARHVCAVLSAWSYSDPDTVAQMMVRMGLESNHCRYMEISNNANSIRSSAYLVQSKCRRVLLLVYRGTDPFDLSTWAVSSDARSVLVPVLANHRIIEGKKLPVLAGNGMLVSETDGAAAARVHGGFYRNQRATWYDIAGALKRAAVGKSILWDLDYADKPSVDEPPAEWKPGATKLFITGHSLGGAMALLAAYRLMSDSAYAEDTTRDILGLHLPALRGLLHSVYTFAQPMVGNKEFAELCDRPGLLGGRLFCHVYLGDVVPHLPPGGLSTEFAHAGAHFHATARNNKDPSTTVYCWTGTPAGKKPRPASSIFALLEAAIGLVTDQLPQHDDTVRTATEHLGFLRDLACGVQDVVDHPFSKSPKVVRSLAAAIPRLLITGAGGVPGVLSALVKELVQIGQESRHAEQADHDADDGHRPYSLGHHAPMNYVAASQPVGTLTEFGDDF